MSPLPTEEDPYTGLAVAVGRLEEGQKHILEGVNDLKKIASDALTQAQTVEREHAVTRRDVDELQEWRKSAEARKPPWTAIGAFMVAAAALIKSLFIP